MTTQPLVVQSVAWHFEISVLFNDLFSDRFQFVPTVVVLPRLCQQWSIHFENFIIAAKTWTRIFGRLGPPPFLPSSSLPLLSRSTAMNVNICVNKSYSQSKKATVLDVRYRKRSTTLKFKRGKRSKKVNLFEQRMQYIQFESHKWYSSSRVQLCKSSLLWKPDVDE